VVVLGSIALLIFFWIHRLRPIDIGASINEDLHGCEYLLI